MAQDAKAAARKLARKLGAKIESGPSGRWYTLIVDAPVGMTWNANGCHGLYGGCYMGEKSWRDAAWADILDEMQYGISPCENEDCDMCLEEGGAE